MKLLLFLASVPLAAQTLSVSCPTPQRFNQSAVCTVNFSGGAAALQWNLVATPPVGISVQSLVPGKTISAGAGWLFMLIGMNTAPLSGAVASVTVPAHSGTVILTLSNPLGSSADGHLVNISPGVSVTVQ